ncbi:Txe/YoeB family addiction module toxin [Kaistia algarum]|uniref:Txe/YoeB family addiction module toxin n=1 Tax=Kaistia algarum TaxID=2083279 RepID=UPI000CE84708|nr:Txe/YoeB family addiction module toxin [Kaistia algarum]MCX5514538.1 Txe/YoeB family addiction module toxin [Kaistia algarum]PPE77592.1 Txe/YoeB family addiction module toxin [Kaistia algarum]
MSSARSLVLAAEALDDLMWWTVTDARKPGRILKLIEEVLRTPTTGTGKPEPLKYLGGSVWSRRIDQEHRLVYAVESDSIRMLQCRYHYERP